LNYVRLPALVVCTARSYPVISVTIKKRKNGETEEWACGYNYNYYYFRRYPHHHSTHSIVVYNTGVTTGTGMAGRRVTTQFQLPFLNWRQINDGLSERG
jgi:hypothetical protein